MEQVTEKIDVMVPYTEKEVAEMNQELAQAFLAYSKVEEAKKSADEGFKADLAGHWEKMNQIASELKAKKHLVNMECVVIFDPKLKTKTYLHPDTDEAIKSVAMQPKDFERELV